MNWYIWRLAIFVYSQWATFEVQVLVGLLVGPLLKGCEHGHKQKSQGNCLQLPEAKITVLTRRTCWWTLVPLLTILKVMSTKRPMSESFYLQTTIAWLCPQLSSQTGRPLRKTFPSLLSWPPLSSNSCFGADSIVVMEGFSVVREKVVVGALVVAFGLKTDTKVSVFLSQRPRLALLWRIIVNVWTVWSFLSGLGTLRIFVAFFCTPSILAESMHLKENYLF